MKWAKKRKTKNGQSVSSGPFSHDAAQLRVLLHWKCFNPQFKYVNFMHPWCRSRSLYLEVCWRTKCSTHSVYFAPFSPQIVVARLDGTLEFLNLGVPTRPAIHSPFQESSPIKRSSPRVTRKTTDASSNNTSASVGIKGTRANISMDSSQCRINHKLRAHHQPISVLDVMDGRVITGSHDRTLKVNTPFAFF